jgi:hypothetical protein
VDVEVQPVLDHLGIRHAQEGGQPRREPTGFAAT